MNRRAAAVSACAAAVAIAIAWREHAHYEAPPPPMPSHLPHVRAGALHGYLGLHFARDYQIDAIEPGSPASRSELRVGDVITAINGETVTAGNALLAAPPGTVVKLGLARGITVAITLGPPREQP